MDKNLFRALSPGDFVRHKSGGKVYIVQGNYGDRVTASRTVDMTNPSEWDAVNRDGSIIESNADVIEALLAKACAK